MKKITYKGRTCYLYTEREHWDSVEAKAIAKKIKGREDFFESLETFFMEEVDVWPSDLLKL